MDTARGAKWFRMWAEFASDPKVQRLSEADQRRFVMLLCLRCSNGDVTLHDDDVAFQLRISMEEWGVTQATLRARDLIDEHNKPTNWDKRQFASDSSTSRVYAWREKKKQTSNADETLQKRPQRQRQSTEKEKNKTLRDPFFERFWEHYPRKVSKADAAKTFAKLNPDEPLFASILAGLERAKIADRRFEDDRFTPHAASWLHSRGWEDEVHDAAYSAEEIAVIDAYNAALADQAWPRAVANPFSSERAASIRRFLSACRAPSGYFAHLAENADPMPGCGFDWAISLETVTRAREGNFRRPRAAA